MPTSPLIIVRLNGGLGNQLFQYAAGFALALSNRAELKLDLSVFAEQDRLRQTNRRPDLLDFSISAPVAFPEEVLCLRNPLGWFSEAIRLIRQKGLKQYYPDWHPEVLRRKGDIYLDGYFQSERYFRSCFEQLAGELALRPEADAAIGEQKAAISRLRNPVSLHVRRGDYVSHSGHDICTPEYFKRAIVRLQDEVGQYELVLFSDDVPWVREHLGLGPDVFVVSGQKGAGGSALTASQELVLMSHCHHHVISNSTFSWWGAYLNRREGKRVLAPSVWNRSRLYPHKNIFPDDWIRVSVY